MLSLVLILLIAICFVLYCFFFNFIRQYLFGLKSCFFVFSGLPLIKSLYPGHRSEN